MGLFDIDRFKEGNAFCRRDGRDRAGPDSLTHHAYKQVMAALSPPSR